MKWIGNTLAGALLFLVIHSSGQNLVNNHSFETLMYDCNYAETPIHMSKGWSSPTRATPDLYYLTTDSVYRAYLQSQNIFARSGLTYAGIYLYNHIGKKPWQEYIQTKLDISES